MSRYICIHGHFYQPPRENPWLEAVEIQDSAHPYHDWNERITAECYAPNGASRLFDGEGRIRDIVSNYARISFNFGPTLLAWMEEYSPAVYRAILEADRMSIGWRSGHGNALAQVYNHIIMPLANRRDKETQVRWGIADFERRFGRFPEGMWLAETAVDTETLDVLAAEGIRFTVLAPHQAARVRSRGGRKWHSVEGGHVDPTMPYLCRLPSGRSLVIFFYDGPISQAVAFEKLLEQGERFAQRLLTGFDDSRNRPQVISIATDGETYGHHHMHGDMALAYALSYLEDNGLARLTNYGEFLELHPPSHEVDIVGCSSWSCIHGIERWRADCGCNSGGYPHWNQQWRGPLRNAFDWLRDELAVPFEMAAGALLHDPWQARDQYIRVIFDRSAEQLDEFFNRHALQTMTEDEQTRILKLLEMQRHLLLMYTSCGWFFDELSGIETVQVIQYAGRAVQLAQELFGNGIEASFIQRLGAVQGNIPEHRDGADIYHKFVRPAMIDLVKVGAHYAVSSLFQEYGEETRVFSYQVQSEDDRLIQAGQTQLAIGRVLVSSATTGESDRITYCVIFFGNHALNGGVRSFRGEEAYGTMAAEITRAFEASDLAEIIRLMDAHFGMHNYSLRDLFRDEQRRILGMVIGGVLAEFEDHYTNLYDSNRLLMGFVRQTGMPVPYRFMTTAQVALNLKLDRTFGKPSIADSEIEELLREIADWGVKIEQVDLEFRIRRRLETTMSMLRDDPMDQRLLADADRLLDLAGRVPIALNLWLAQNIYLEIARPCWHKLMEYSRRGDARNDWWFEEFRQLGERLNFNTHAILPSLSEE